MLMHARLAIFWLASITSAIYLLYAATIRQPVLVPTPPPIAVHETRGPRDPGAIEHEKWISELRQRTTPTEFGSVALLQMAGEAITVNAEIPIWGVFMAILVGVGAFFALREQMKNHIKSDDASFLEVKDAIKDLSHKIDRLQRFTPDD